MKLKNKLEVVEWADSYSPSDIGWKSIAEMEEPDNMVCISVGWIEKETKDNITIVPHITDIYDKKTEGYGYGILTIPKGVILKRTKIKY